MGPDLTETPRAAACPSCGAAVRPDAPWCTLCYADLRPKAPEPPAPVAPVTAAVSAPAGDPLTQPLVDFLPAAPGEAPAAVLQPQASAAATWPCSVCDAVNPMTADSCSVCQNPFLAAMRQADKPALVLPLVGDVLAMSRGRRVALACALVVALLLPLALLTLLLTHRPPTDTTTPTTPGTSQTTTTTGGTPQ